ncbi:F0F1 ATP synthase subunit delta [Bacillus shivajii]|uniref:F0F1 ATP synthase subunit delta n=1 Tax=Bacillus shivajii TaxID=1983719 RepID=UPI001CF97548|nr:F0F1 ATP synthase subunit delta [Bacillus shivajii]UCZ53021.1 F0F1 ATP synthase subunit delta [Bacillus shivajii]
MRRHQVGFPYASALYDIAKGNQSVDQTAAELEAVTQVLNDTKLLDEVFKHPKVSNKEKKQLIQDNFSAHISQTVLNMLFFLVDRKREDAIFAIKDEFDSLINEDQGIAKATVTTAKPLKDDEKSTVAEVFTKASGKKQLLIENVVDKSIIGGLKVRIGDRIYDGSIARQLNDIQQQMIQGNVSR